MGLHRFLVPIRILTGLEQIWARVYINMFELGNFTVVSELVSAILSSLIIVTMQNVNLVMILGQINVIDIKQLEEFITTTYSYANTCICDHSVSCWCLSNKR